MSIALVYVDPGGSKVANLPAGGHLFTATTFALAGRIAEIPVSKADCTMSLMRWRTNLFLTSPAFWRGFLLVRGVRFSMVSDHPQVVREGDETHKIRRQTREVTSEYLRRVANFYRHHHRVPHRIQKHLTNLIANSQLNAFQVQTLPVPTYAKPFTLTGATGER